jgi:tetratricopeptide (TPR) repeat protein
MTNKRNSMWLEARIGFFICVLFCLFAGCNSYLSEYPIKTDPITLSEDDLIIELNRNYRHPMAHYRLGLYYHAHQQLEKAENKYIDALNRDPAHKPSQAALVKLYLDKGNRAKAANLADSYIRQAMVSVEQALLLSSEFEKQGLEDYSLRCLLQAQQELGESAGVNKALGVHYFNKGEMALAKEYLTKSFNLDRNQPDVSYMLGKLEVVIEVPEEL